MYSLIILKGFQNIIQNVFDISQLSSSFVHIYVILAFLFYTHLIFLGENYRFVGHFLISAPCDSFRTQ